MSGTPKVLSVWYSALSGEMVKCALNLLDAQSYTLKQICWYLNIHQKKLFGIRSLKYYYYPAPDPDLKGEFEI